MICDISGTIPENTVIYGYEDSYAQIFVDDFNRKFVPIEFGDIDVDGTLSVMDATAIQLHLAQIQNINRNLLKLGDTDDDGKTSVVDATRIQLFIAQLIPEL